MAQIFLQVINMSVTASIVILAVCFGRGILKQAPKILSYALWLVVLIRLVCPAAVATPMGMIPEGITEDLVFALQQDAGSNTVDDNQPVPIMAQQKAGSEHGLQETHKREQAGLQVAAKVKTKASTKPSGLLTTLGVIWIIGIVVWIIRFLLSYCKLQKQLSVLLKDKKTVEWKPAYGKGTAVPIIKSKSVKEPFVSGIIHPAVFLPTELTFEQERYVLAHELIHIRRKDYLIKPAAFLVTVIHWFNPLVWLAFWLMEKDMELSCDEAVLKKMGAECKKDYALTLLELSAVQAGGLKRVVSFGGNQMKDRIKNAMKYKKTRVWVSVVMTTGVLLAAVCLLTNSEEQNQDLAGVDEKLYNIQPINTLNEWAVVEKEEAAGEQGIESEKGTNSAEWIQMKEETFPVEKLQKLQKYNEAEH